MKASKGIKLKPRNVLLYGQQGTGKTSLAASFPSPFLFDIESGSGDIDVERYEDFMDYNEFQEGVAAVLQRTDIKTVIIDTVDWMEKLLQKYVAEKNGKESIEDIGYGKGYKKAAEEFDKTYINFLKSFNKAGMTTVSICHAKAFKFSPPDESSYDKWGPDLDEKICSPLREFCDEVFFLKKRTFTKKEELGFKKERNIAITTEERILVTFDTGPVVAKNRLNMPSEIPATFASYAQYILAKREQATQQEQGGNINGIVKDGSSKPKNEAAEELTNTTVF